MKLPAVLLLSCVAAVYSIEYVNATHVTGWFGYEVIPMDIEFGDDVMITTIHRPDNAPDTFRETTNLHIFSKHVVAVRNSIDMQCYVHPFKESKEELSGRVKMAEYNNGQIDRVMEERLNLEGIDVISPRTVQLLLGSKIAKFCLNHDVYLISRKDYTLLDPKDFRLERREKRKASAPVDVAGNCVPCENWAQV